LTLSLHHTYYHSLRTESHHTRTDNISLHLVSNERHLLRIFPWQPGKGSGISNKGELCQTRTP